MAVDCISLKHNFLSVQQMAVEKRRPGRVCVVVLGDVGRSPRMCYHAESLAARGHAVDVVGYVRQDAAKLSVSRAASLYSLWAVPGWISGWFSGVGDVVGFVFS